MTKAQPISSTDLYLQLGTVHAPVLIDVRTERNSNPDQRLIVSARPMPVTPEQWTIDLESGQQFVVYSGEDDEASEGVADALCSFGKDARYLDGGIACPWLIRRFIDPDAEFIYVPADRVLDEAKVLGAIPYDIPDVEFTHEGDRCSFDTFLRLYDIADPPLERLALIVRGADTSRHDLAPQCGGLFAISLGLSANFPDDHEMLDHGMVIYDALYTWCRSLQAETHDWPPR